MPGPSFPRFPAGQRELESFEGPRNLDHYGDFDDLMVAADREGIVDVAAESADEAHAGTANRVRAPAIAEKLRLLGYLHDSEDSGLSDDPESRQRFLDAVRAFQRGAQLVEDGWAGDKTWRALRELVTFETSTDVNTYVLAGQPLPALNRAVRLRLSALGLLDAGPTLSAVHNALPVKALSRFWEWCGRLGMVEFASAPRSLETIERLFDQDTLVQGIARSTGVDDASGKRAFTYLSTASEKSDRPRIEAALRRFLVSVTKVELWLLGFEDVALDGLPNYPVRGFGRAEGRSDKTLRKALGLFWSGLGGRSGKRVERSAKRITPELFDAFAQPEIADGASAVADGDHSRAVLKQVGKSNKRIEGAWSEGRSLRLRLWDGLKRLWRWIKRGFGKILKIGRNLSRAFYRYALKAFQIARFAVRTVVRTLGQYVKGRIRTGEGNPVHLRLFRDGDMQVVIPDRADPVDVHSATRSADYFGAAFRFSCRILARLLDAIWTAAKTVGSVVHWARFVWVLVRSYREIRPLYRELRELPVPAAQSVERAPA